MKIWSEQYDKVLVNKWEGVSFYSKSDGLNDLENVDVMLLEGCMFVDVLELVYNKGNSNKWLSFEKSYIYSYQFYKKLKFNAPLFYLNKNAFWVV